ncbi:hypothetical protein ACJ41O_003578 [Fusarium nematophilum]
MELNQLPPEILYLILAYLVEPSDTPTEPQNPDFVSYACAARLVCRKWNQLATPHLYQTLDLSKFEGAYYLDRWNNLLDLQTARQAAQHVIIYTGQDDFPDDLGHDLWSFYGMGRDVAFISAIDRIIELPKLSRLTLEFPDISWTPRDDSGWDEHLIMKESRDGTLTAVLDAMVKRAAHPDNVAIRSLTILHLLGHPIPGVTSSHLFKEATRHVGHLHLQISSSYAPLSDHYDDPFCKEQRQFEPFLQLELLPPLAGQLRALTLASRTNWGICSGSFDGRGLLFPNLQILTLGNYVIGSHGQFDWVLAQKSLKALHLDRCCIVSHLRIHEHLAEKWGLRTNDWKEWPSFSFGNPYRFEKTFTFPGTWETTFDDIRNELPNLVDFRFNWAMEGTYFCRPDEFRTELSPMRYIRFKGGLRSPGAWIEADEQDGHLGFTKHEVQDPRPVTDEEASILNPARDREEGDGLALNALLRVTEGRRRLG